MKEKVEEETEVDWGQLKKVTVEEQEAAVVEEVVQVKKVEQEATEIPQLGPRRQSVLVRAEWHVCSLYAAWCEVPYPVSSLL